MLSPPLSKPRKTPSDRAVLLSPNATVADRRYSQSREEILLSIFARCFVGPRHFRENATCLSVAAGEALSWILLGRRWNCYARPDGAWRDLGRYSALRASGRGKNCVDLFFR